MARGAPDYSNVSAYGPLHRVDDDAELAARLGSLLVYDRAGSLVWMSDFRYGLQGAVPGTSDAECSYSVSVERAHFGPFSIKLDPSDETGSYVEWGTSCQFMEAGRLGLEALISLGSTPDGVRIKLHYYDGGDLEGGQLHYDPATGDWTILNSAGGWTTILEGFKLQKDATTWNPIKLVIDAENDMYVRAQMAKEVIDLSAYSLRSVESDNLGQLNGLVTVYGSSALHAPIFIDAVVITQNEPDNP